MSSPQRPAPQDQGLGQSKPLVTVAGGPPSLSGARTAASQQQNLTSVTGHHPLAPPPPVVQSSDPGQSVEVSIPTIPQPTNSAPTPPQPPPPPSAPQVGYPPSSRPSTAASQYASPPPPPPPQAAASPNNRGGPTNYQSPVQSLDDLVDTFLSGPSFRSEQQLPPLLRPPPLVNENPLQCLRTLVERRAWGDVLQVTADLLRGADSLHAPIYNSLLSSEANSPNDNPSNTSSVSSDQQLQLREETAEVLALQCHAWLKLRRYSDLGQEIDRWNFVSFSEGYNADQAPSWVPWSLRK